MITPRVAWNLEKKLKTENTQAAEKALMDLLKTGWAATSGCLQDAFKLILKHILTEMNLRDTLVDPFI